MGIVLRFRVPEQVAAEQIENRLQQILVAMKELDPLEHGQDIIARPRIQFDIIDVDLAQAKDVVLGNSLGVS